MNRPSPNQFPEPRSPQDLASYCEKCREYAGSDGVLYAELVEEAIPLGEWGNWSDVWEFWKAERSRVINAVAANAIAQPDGAAEEWLFKQTEQERFAALAKIGTDRAFNAIVTEIDRCENNEIDGYQEPWWALSRMAIAFPEQRDAVIKILLRSMESRYGICVTGAIHAIWDLKLRDAIPALKEILSRAQKKSSYGMDMAAGRAAVVLSLFDDHDAVEEIDASYSKAHPFHNDNISFINEFRYSLWMLRSDAAGAQKYIEDPQHRVGLSYAACALADLQAQDSLPSLISARTTIRSKICRAAFDEAIVRLESGIHKMTPEERMIHLFGRRSRNELATGAESDDQFIQRSRADSTVEEVDDSGSLDR